MKKTPNMSILKKTLLFLSNFIEKKSLYSGFFFLFVINGQNPKHTNELMCA